LQGTLREALDHKILLRNSTNGYLQPTIMLSLAHDIAAALLHLHSEGKSARQARAHDITSLRRSLHRILHVLQLCGDARFDLAMLVCGHVLQLR
jgi:hypothetical protein